MAKEMKMIMKKNLFVSAAIMAAMTACVPVVEVVEDVQQEESKVWVEFSAGVQTKAAFELGETTATVKWEATDLVNINGVEFSIPEEDDAISEDGKVAKFKAQVDESFLGSDKFTAIYPASVVDANGNITVAATSQGKEVIIAKAEVESPSDILEFKHVTSYFKFQVPSEVSVVTISATEALAGTVKNVVFGENEGKTTVSYELVTESAVEPTSETEDETETETETEAVPSVITVTLPEDAKFQPETDYLVSVLPGEKTNLTVSFDGNVAKTWANPVNVKYAMIANMGVLPEPLTTVYLKPSIEWETAVTEAGYAAVVGEKSYAMKEVDVDGDEVLDGIYTVSVPLKAETLKFVVNGKDKTTTDLVLPTTESNVYCVASQSWKTIEEATEAKTTPTITINLPETFTFGGSFELSYTVNPAEAAEYVEINVEGATYDNGVVSLTNVGEVTITLSIDETDFYAANAITRTFTVGKATGTLSVVYDNTTLKYGETATATVTVNPDVKVTYTSSDESIAKVDVNGNVSTGDGVTTKVGSVTITAKVEETSGAYVYEDVEVSFKVELADREVSFENDVVVITYGDSFTGQTLADVTGVTYEVISGDGAATVNTTGEVEIVKAGTVTIKATVAATATHNECYAEYTLTVNKAKRANAVGFSKSSDEVTYGTDATYTEPELTNLLEGDVVSYAVTEGTDVVEVAATTGNITTKKAGTATIKATITSDKYEDATASYTLTVKQYVYLVPNINWCDASARFAAYFYADGKTDKWVDMTNDGNIYKCEVEAGYTNVIFCRMNPSQKENNWNNKWNQTVDLDVPSDDQIYYFINGWGDNSKWETYDFCKTYFNPSGKLYLVPTDGWKQNNERYAAYFFEDGKSETWVSLTSTNEFTYFNGAYEVTPPEGYTNIIFCRMNGSQSANNWNNKWDQTANLKVSSGSLYTMPSAQWITISY